MMSLLTSRRGRSQSFRNLVAILCVLLILFAGTAQVLHTHATGEAANPGCSLCAVAHSTSLVEPVVATPVAAETVAPVAQPDPVAAPKRRVSFRLYVRPPPALTTHA